MKYDKNFCPWPISDRTRQVLSRIEDEKMPAKPITIGVLSFPKKGDAAEYIKEMLNRYDVGDKVSTTDESFLRSALAFHPEASRKVGCGVTHFSVRRADFGTKCFWLNRLDGTTEKFSYIACVYG